MSVHPVSLSTEAAAWIVENLEKSAEELKKKVGGAADLIPILGFAYGYQVWDKDHNLRERCDVDHFDLGWTSAEGMDPGGFLQIEISGFKVFVQHSTLKILEGKELILETVEVGYPMPASTKRQLLRARPKEV